MTEITCDNCNEKFKLHKCYLKRERKHRFCSKKCEADFKNYHNTIENWQGGHVSSSTGYKYIRYKGKQIEEHRLVMMKHLKRELKTNEHVHHLNGNKLDNRIENLVLLSNAEHHKLHGSLRNNKRVCSMCNEHKKHHGRGLCDTCYHRVLMEGRLKDYELTRK